MKILFAASEAHPLVKVGGLGDVAGSLPPALAALGHDVRVVIPAYRHTATRLSAPRTAAQLALPGATVPVRIVAGQLPGTEVPVYLVDSPEHYDRPGGPYTNPDGVDWPDNAERFAVLGRAVTAIAQNRAGLGWAPDLVHCNDWQAGLAPALLALETTRPATVFTIHNLSYLGLYPWSTFRALGLPYELWSMSALEFHGSFAFIKGGLVYADAVTTVSPTYAREICTPRFGHGLEGVLAGRGASLVGILNGVDYATWDPQSDPHIEHPYSARAPKHKSINKLALQRRLELPEEASVPLIAHIGRLVSQKGVDLLLDALPELLKTRVQVVVLGSGDRDLETALKERARRHPGRLGVHLGYDEALAHQIEAGADIFVMPSRFEPCGMNQMFSLRYGTPPVVHRTGGLADTVVDATEERLARDEGTGFAFDTASAGALVAALQRALILYYQPRRWQKLMRRGMKEDFSWSRSAHRYGELYATLVGRRPPSATAATPAAAPHPDPHDDPDTV